MNENNIQENTNDEVTPKADIVLPVKEDGWNKICKRDIIISLLFLSLVGYGTIDHSVQLLKNPASGKNTNEEKKVDFFAGINIEGEGAIVWDAKEDKVLYAKNEHVKLPLASLVKIMTTYLALGLDGEVVTISKKDILSEGDSGLMIGEDWKLTELAKLTLVASANDGASSLSSAWLKAKKLTGEEDASFVDTMNASAQTMGLSEITFLNDTGLDVSNTESGAYGSADNVARLFYQAVTTYPEVFEATSQPEISVDSLSHKTHRIKNTNEIVGELTGIIASKTGFTDLAGGNLVVMVGVGLNHPVIAVVLGSTEKGRFSDIKKLIDAVVLNSRYDI